eukprot:5544661-Pleurochrysis_carterae.AAC.2
MPSFWNGWSAVCDFMPRNARSTCSSSLPVERLLSGGVLFVVTTLRDALSTSRPSSYCDGTASPSAITTSSRRTPP